MATAAAAQHQELRFPKGAIIFRQGDPGNEMFVISAGRVQLTIGTGGHEKEVAVLGPGEFFGELSLTNEAPRSASARALDDAALLVIGRDVFAMMVQDDLDIVFRMMKRQGERLSDTNQPIQDFVQRMGRIRVAAHCLRRVAGSSRELPLTLDTTQLATQVGLSAEATNATVADLVQAGVGSLQDHRWSIQTPEQVDTLIDALCRYSVG